MGIREQINKFPGIMAAIGILVIAIAVAYAIHSTKPSAAYNLAFFTTDDGKTIFSADMDSIPPFQHDGSDAVRAWVFTCDGGKTRFVGYLERYSSAAKPKFDAAMNAYRSGKLHTPPSPGPQDMEVKKPGVGNSWVSEADPRAAQIMKVQCPDGGKIQMLFP